MTHLKEKMIIMAHTSETLQQAFGYLFPDEVSALKKLAFELPPKSIVINIGAGAGTSSLAFLEARDDLFLHSVDTIMDDSPLGCLTAEKREVSRAGLLCFGNGEPRFQQHHQSSVDLGRQWNRQEPFVPVNMIFIDGDHSYEGCRNDILVWLPNLVERGVLAVHDFNKQEVYARPDLPAKIPHPQPWPGVDRAVRECLMAKYEAILNVDTLIAFRITN
jgi:hypothetical protein